jgi:hypothetical protein
MVQGQPRNQLAQGKFTNTRQHDSRMPYTFVVNRRVCRYELVPVIGQV